MAELQPDAALSEAHAPQATPDDAAAASAASSDALLDAAAEAATAPSEPAPAPDSAAAASPAVAAPLANSAAGTMSPGECAQRLKALFPGLFAGAPKPVKLRIQIDIQARAPGVFSRSVLSGFFRRHTGSTSYLIAVTRAPHRFDLDGQPGGEVTAEHRQVALDELARRRASTESRRELEEQQRRNRAGLLHDYQTTTLTPANFCALKGVAVEELEGLLTLARTEFEDRARQMPAMREPPARATNEPRRDSRPDGRGRRSR